MMKIRTIGAAIAATALSAGLMAGLAPAAGAVDNPAPAGCTQADRTALRDEVAGLKSQLQNLRLSPDEIAAKKAERQKAVSDIKAKYGVPGAKLSATDRAAMKAEIDAAIADGRKGATDRRTQIDPIKAKLKAAHDELQACRAAARPKQ